MIYDLKSLPKNKASLITLDEVVLALQDLIGREFILTGKTRTDGSNLRKFVQSAIQDYLEKKGDYDDNNDLEGEVISKKGLPKLLNQLLDTYIVTRSDCNYNLQVRNRKPTGNYPVAILSDGTKIAPKDIRIVLVCIEDNFIKNITVFLPEYIEKLYGKFGKPTIKHQILIPPSLRKTITQNSGLLIGVDTDKVSGMIGNCMPDLSRSDIKSFPNDKNIVSIKSLQEIVRERIRGYDFNEIPQTKNKGQELERIIIDSLGYINKGGLEGLYPDLRHQRLEIKIQDSPTIDLGRFSPLFDELIDKENDLYISDVRYLIALTEGSIVTGMILLPGRSLEQFLTYIGDTSFKCQRSLPKELFTRDISKSILVNPPLNQ